MTAAARKTASEIIIPAEWAVQKALWAGWPSHGDLWLENLAPAQAEVAKMIALIAEDQVVKVAAMGDDAVAAAKAALPHKNVEVFNLKFGDIWIRDTGPVFSFAGMNLAALRFRNNGWGGKYDLAHDDTIGDEIAGIETKETIVHDFVLEGGAVENDGEGTILTTRQCMLNKNRNGWSEAEAEEHLKKAFGAQKILWLDEGLAGDHTDGHIDNIVRFIAPGKVVCQRPFGKDDPNAALFKKITHDLEQMTDAQGRKLEIFRISSPGLVKNEDGEPAAASHVNFIIGNKTIVVPTYDTKSTQEAVAGLQKLFPDRKVVGVGSRAVLTGGGSFHCMTQQVPE